MGAPRILKETVGTFTFMASVNGRSRSNVMVYGEDETTPLVADEFNLSSATQRSKFLDRLPEAIGRNTADEVCKRLAAGVVAEQATNVPGPRDDEAPEAAWSQPVSGVELLDEICVVIHRYVVMPADAMRACALWALHTYVLEAASFSGYLWLSSATAEAGKTLTLDVLEGLVYQPYRAEGLTAATMFRIIADRQPTLIVDELDTMMRTEGSEDLRGCLNAGFRRGSKFLRCVGDNHEVKEFAVFCPKLLAGIGTLPNTIASRAIPIRMERATRDERRRLVRLDGARFREDRRELRQKLLRWAADSLAELRGADPGVPDELGARQADIWRPLLAIADLVGDSGPHIARCAAISLHTPRIATDTQDVGEQLLADVREVFDSLGQEKLSTEMIVSELARMDDRLWPEWSHGKPMSPSAFSKQMRRFDLKSKTIRMAGVPARGFERRALEPLFARYLPHQGVTSVTTLLDNDLGRNTSTPVTGHLLRPNSLQGKLVTLVTVPSGEVGTPDTSTRRGGGSESV